MTVEIDPDDPARFTCAWIALPVRSVAFPLLMGQTHTPECLLDGRTYALGKKVKGDPELLEATEERVRASKEQLKAEIAGLPGNAPEQTAQALNQWSKRQAEMLLELLQAQ